MSAVTAAKSIVSIGPINAVADDQTAYEALTYVELGEAVNAGEFGDAYNEVAYTNLADGRVKKHKGSADAGSFEVSLARDMEDAGQQDLHDALGSYLDHAFKVELNDGVTTPTTFYFRGKVMRATTDIGEADSMVMSNATISINSAIVEVAAT